MTIYGKSGGSWGSGSTERFIWVKNNGSWVKAKNAWVKDGGTWKQFQYENPRVSYSGSYYTASDGGNTYMYLTGSGTLTVSEHPFATQAVLVGGGGGGGGVADRTAGGGGAGGYWNVPLAVVPIGSHSTYIGGGGAGGTYWAPGNTGGQTYSYGIMDVSDNKVYVANGGRAGGGVANGYIYSPGVGASYVYDDPSYYYSASSGGGGSHRENMSGAGGTQGGGKGWDVYGLSLYAGGGGGAYGNVGQPGFVNAPPPPGYTTRYNHSGDGGQGFTINGQYYCYGGGGGLQGARNSPNGDIYWYALYQASGGDPNNPTHGQGGWYSGVGDYGATSARANSGGGGGGGGQRDGGGTYSSGNGGSGVIILIFNTALVDII